MCHLCLNDDALRIYDLKLDARGEVACENRSQIFDPILYSQFKYGNRTIADYYAEKVCQLLDNLFLPRNSDYFLCSSAYQEVPTAATSITDRLYASLTSRGYNIHYFKINGKAFNQDCSTLNADERKGLLDSIPLYINKRIQEKIRGKTVIVLDDIRVTGLHSKYIKALLSSAGVKKSLFCYVATLPLCQGRTNAKVESTLNHWYINSLERLARIVNSQAFAPNARICKFILSSDKKSIENFSKVVQPEKLSLLLELMRQDNYHLINEYRSAYNMLRDFSTAKERQQVLVAIY